MILSPTLEEAADSLNPQGSVTRVLHLRVWPDRNPAIRERTGSGARTGIDVPDRRRSQPDADRAGPVWRTAQHLIDQRPAITGR